MQPRCALPVDEIRLGAPAFWKLPLEEREGAFLTLRRERPVSFHDQLDPRLPSGPGFWALTRHADVLEAGTTPKVFSSARGIGIVDLPPEFLEFFGSTLATDGFAASSRPPSRRGSSPGSSARWARPRRA
jgi:cytochrome P450